VHSFPGVNTFTASFPNKYIRSEVQIFENDFLSSERITVKLLDVKFWNLNYLFIISTRTRLPVSSHVMAINNKFL
jgi:hypothetical protein